MRSLYLPTDKRERIAYCRQAAKECAAKGMDGLAELNEEMAAYLEGELRAAAKQELRNRER